MNLLLMGPTPAPLSLIVCYLLVMNVIGFAIMGSDKKKAQKHTWRIPESRLFLISLIGGSLGTMMGMYIWHHKTRHWYFRFGMPLIFILHLAALCGIIFYFR